MLKFKVLYICFWIRFIGFVVNFGGNIGIILVGKYKVVVLCLVFRFNLLLGISKWVGLVICIYILCWLFFKNFMFRLLFIFWVFLLLIV